MHSYFVYLIVLSSFVLNLNDKNSENTKFLFIAPNTKKTLRKYDLPIYHTLYLSLSLEISDTSGLCFK